MINYIYLTMRTLVNSMEVIQKVKKKKKINIIIIIAINNLKLK